MGCKRKLKVQLLVAFFVAQAVWAQTGTPPPPQQQQLQFDTRGCAQQKGCLFYPPNCQPDVNCVIKFSYLLNQATNRLEMHLNGRVGANQYVAFGFSDDDRMGDDMVVSCENVNGQVRGGLSTNSASRSNNPVTQQGILQVTQTGSVNGEIACIFSLPFVPPANVGGLKNLRGSPFYALMATAAVGPNGQLEYHSTNRAAFPRTDFAVYQLQNDGQTQITGGTGNMADVARSQTDKFLMAHGILMTFAFTVFLSTGILFARHFRSHWPTTTVMGVKLWFHLHRTLNIVGIIATICGFVIIFVANDWRWVGPKATQSEQLNRSWGSIHAILGLLACVIAWQQPLNAVFRCAPDGKTRFIFNWIHRFFGFSSLILGFAAIMIACVHFTSMFENRDAALGLFIAFVAVYGLTLIVMEIFSFRRWWGNRSRVRASEMEMSRMGVTATPAMYDDDEGDNTNLILLALMVFHVIVAVGVAVAIAVLIAKKP